MKSNPLWSVCVRGQESSIRKTSRAAAPWQRVWRRNHCRWLLLWLMAEHLGSPETRLLDSSFELTSTVPPSACRESQTWNPESPTGWRESLNERNTGGFSTSLPPGKVLYPEHKMTDISCLLHPCWYVCPKSAEVFRLFNLFNSLGLKLKVFGYILTG